jgi:PAS domain S-box-containing protein
MTDSSTILIVDDQLSVRNILQALLAKQGYNLAFANNGQEALSQAAELTPDLILLDVMMPDMDGFEVCERLRADPNLAEVPIMMITALDDPKSRLRGLQMGADDFVTKPFNGIELLARVRTTTRLNRYRRLLQERASRRQAEEQIHRRNRELSLLNQIITTTASTLNLQETLYVACEALANVFELAQVTGILLDEERSKISTTVEYSDRDSSQRHQESGTPTEAAALDHDLSEKSLAKDGNAINAEILSYLIEHQTVLEITGEQTEPHLSQIYTLMQASGFSLLLLVPILKRDQVVGLIELASLGHRHFNDHDLTLAQSVATAIGQAMETVQLHQSLQRHVENLEETVAQRTRELETERDRTQSILQALGEAVVVTDLAGTIQYTNPATALLTGFDGEDLLGQTYWHLWQYAQQPVELDTQFEHSTHSGQTWRGEVIFKRKDGSIYDAALTVAALFAVDQNQPIGFVSVHRDISPLKEAERAKNKFVSNVSHELRTPLSVITLVTDNLETLYDRLDDPQRRDMIGDIQKHAQVLNDLIGDVLEISRIDSNQISTNQKRLNLAQLVCEEIDKLLPLAKEKFQVLNVLGLDDVPVRGHDGQLRQAIRNILNSSCYRVNTRPLGFPKSPYPIIF